MTDQPCLFPLLTYIFRISCFIITVSILLMNLLIGLAVGDIGNVQREATLRRIGMQVDLHTGLERRLPEWILKRVAFQEDKYYPNRPAGFLRKHKTAIRSCRSNSQRNQVQCYSSSPRVSAFFLDWILNRRLQDEQSCQGNIGQLHTTHAPIGMQKMEINERKPTPTRDGHSGRQDNASQLHHSGQTARAITHPSKAKTTAGSFMSKTAE
ncbi:putative Transient receptor potential cation channel subfamily A member 1 [Hypsibius exemplaris]|uniref:Transient receptor potential cation channel subfamily A member 1 n=1 Tax=Hypsibius exemplaris TaxID=2072580 RepID=A0A1W0WHZ4_HYPEX|nr:putative Transient receptor potential cation channel subfamily A member 1 [Hypsibius exemplaris]